MGESGIPVRFYRCARVRFSSSIDFAFPVLKMALYSGIKGYAIGWNSKPASFGIRFPGRIE